MRMRIYMNLPTMINDPQMKESDGNFRSSNVTTFGKNPKNVLIEKQTKIYTKKFILKDKNTKIHLAQKVEKGCLKCGCGLGGVAAVENAAMLVAAQKGIDAGIAKAIEELGKIVGLSDLSHIYWAAKINGTNFFHKNSLVTIVNEVNYKCIDIENSSDFLFCSATKAWDKQNSTLALQTISTQAAEAAVAAGKAAETAEKAEIVLVNAKSSLLYSAIGYSVMAILIILLVMKKENEYKTTIYKIIKSINMWFHNIKFNLMFCEF
ncbi:rifin [Plasmodium falciparum RAJ116]|uniref:Rifin n=1 Tax=Plasmodium falciparum RAJ116 TaxID=580058 RepID=A0A0L0D190_PLAFA|nr:rifin [Plasmodium falciparum RAJ116]